MNKNTRIMAGMLVPGAIGMVVAIEGNADHGSRYVCTATVKGDKVVKTAASHRWSL